MHIDIVIMSLAAVFPNGAKGVTEGREAGKLGGENLTPAKPTWLMEVAPSWAAGQTRRGLSWSVEELQVLERPYY